MPYIAWALYSIPCISWALYSIPCISWAPYSIPHIAWALYILYTMYLLGSILYTMYLLGFIPYTMWQRLKNIGLVASPGGRFGTRLVTESWGLATSPPRDKPIEDYSTLHRCPRQGFVKGGPRQSYVTERGGGHRNKPPVRGTHILWALHYLCIYICMYRFGPIPYTRSKNSTQPTKNYIGGSRYAQLECASTAMADNLLRLFNLGVSRNCGPQDRTQVVGLLSYGQPQKGPQLIEAAT